MLGEVEQHGDAAGWRQQRIHRRGAALGPGDEQAQNGADGQPLAALSVAAVSERETEVAAALRQQQHRLGGRRLGDLQRRGQDLALASGVPSQQVGQHGRRARRCRRVGAQQRAY